MLDKNTTTITYKLYNKEHKVKAKNTSVLITWHFEAQYGIQVMTQFILVKKVNTFPRCNLFTYLK